jgi:hypothetical protein
MAGIDDCLHPRRFFLKSGRPKAETIEKPQERTVKLKRTPGLTLHIRS